MNMHNLPQLRGLTLFCAIFWLLQRMVLADAAVEGRVVLPKEQPASIVAKCHEIVPYHGVLSTKPPLAVVYLAGSFPSPVSAPTEQIVQRDLAFFPAFLPVQAGTRVEFPNLDNTPHSIFSYSRARRFDLGWYRNGERPVPSEVFDTPGLVTLRCNIHEHMRGLILVLPTPYFTVTDADGRFRLKGLPTGRHTLKAWIDGNTTREQSLELKDGMTAHVDFP